MKTKQKSEQGSALIVAMIFTVLLAMLTASYLDVALTDTKLSNRTYHAAAAMNIAETGLEEGIWTLNKYLAGDADALVGWTIDGTSVTRTFNSGFQLGQNTGGAVKVYIKNYNGVAMAPTVVAHAKLSLPQGSPVEKWVEISLIKRSLFASGLVAKKTILFNGNFVEIDSWVSGADQNQSTAAPYSSGVARDNGKIGSVLVDSTVAVNNADVWGFASVGGSNANAISVGSQGRVGPYGTPAGQKPNVSTDFTAPMDPLVQPIGSSALIITNTSQLPATLSSDPKNPTIVIANSINLQNTTLQVKGYVRFVLSAPLMTSAISIGGGSGKLTVGGTDATGASIPSGIEVYTAGDIDISGQGLTNGYTTSSGTVVIGTPLSVQIYGTNTSTTTMQKITVSGNGALSAVCYAPNADLTINGGGKDDNDIMGSFVCNTVTMNGHAKFHYDESLAKVGGSNPYRINLWRELITGNERSEYQAQLAMD